MLTPEDNLRLNVLLATRPDAIRIDESQLWVYGLSAKGEAKIRLNPNCRAEQYLRQVREMLSGHILNSPGGYPVYLKRWTRMGQARGEDSLRQLLLLGEPEAIVAVVHSPDLTPELASYAWWAMPLADNARKMLQNPTVALSDMGQQLAHYLLEHLAFEEEAGIMIETVRLILQANLITPEQAQQLWHKERKLLYRVGFLLARPHQLPQTQAAHPDYPQVAAQLTALCTQGNKYAQYYCQLLSAPGQAFLQTSYHLLEKPSNQDMMVATLKAIEHYFAPLPLPAFEPHRQIEPLQEAVKQLCSGQASGAEALQPILQTVANPEAVYAMLFLALLREAIILPIFSTTTAIGSLMRQKLQPVTRPILRQIDCLIHKT